MKSFKQLIIIAVAFLVFLGTLGLESVFAGPSQARMKGHLLLVVPAGQSVEVKRESEVKSLGETASFELMVHDEIAVKSGSGVQVRFSDAGVVRLTQDAVVNVAVADSQKDAYVLELQKGRLWANNLYTSAYFNVVANGAFVIPDYAAVDVRVDGSKTFVYAHRHHASIGLVPLAYKAQEAKRFPDESFINSFTLAEGNQTTVFADKITENEETLRKLFYSKLVKEFPFGVLDAQQLSTDSWLKDNIAADKVYESKIADESSQQIRGRGLKIADLSSFGYSFGQALNGVYNTLTFSGAKVIARTNDDIFDHFDDAKYLLLFGQTTRAKERLDFFHKSLDQALAEKGQDYKLAVLERLRDEHDRLSYVTGDNALSQAKMVLVQYLLGQLGSTEDDIREKFIIVRNTMNGVYDLADINSQSARQALEDYFAQFTQVVNQEKTRMGKLRNILAEENQIMDNLFRFYPIFYRDRFFAMKSQLEQQWLALLPEGEGKNEEKQTIVSTKIDFLRQLKTFFLADKIAVDDAKQIVFRLFRESDDLQLPADQQVAVNDLYAKRLNDFGVFFRYLNSPEYVATSLHGSSRKVQFDQFVQAQQEQVSIEEIRQEILGNQAAPVITPEKILAQAQKDFADIGAQNVQFGPFNDIKQKILALNSATVLGVEIHAQYAWDSRLVSQIYTGDTLISADPVNLANLARLIKTKTEVVPETPDVPVMPTPSPTPASSPTPAPAPTGSKTERVAKILLIQKLKVSDIALTEADLSIVDLALSKFTVSKAILVSDQSISFSFDIDGKNNVVTNLVLFTKDGQHPVVGTFGLTDVSDRLKSEVQALKSASSSGA